jgi:hypothetical protein
MMQLITQGVFDRHVSLHIAYAECGAGWIPYYAEQADSNYMRHRSWAKIELAHQTELLRETLFPVWHPGRLLCGQKSARDQSRKYHVGDGLSSRGDQLA